MTDLERHLRNALRSQEEDGPEAPDPSVSGMILQSFRGRSRATTLFAWMKMSATLAICAVAAVFFFVVESVQAQIAWATCFSAGFVGFAMWWIWYWMFLNRNAALREIKRLELQIAELRAASSEPGTRG